MSHSLIYLGESAYDMQEFVNSTAKFVIAHEDNRKGFVHLVPLVTSPDRSLEWLHYHSTTEIFSWIMNEH